MTAAAAASPQGPVAGSVEPSPFRQDLLVAAALLLLAAVTLAPWITRLGLMHDDWPLVHDMARGKVAISSVDGSRPLLGLPWRLCGLLFGDALVGYYAFLFALQWLAATFLYLLARRFSPPGFAAALAALSMVYPADASQLWLGTLTQRTAWVMALAAVWLAERGRDRPRFMAAPLALVVLSLGLYELPLLLLASWPAIAWGLGAPWRRRAIFVWSAIPVLYLAWRFLARPLWGAPIAATATFSWAPLVVARRALVLVPYNLFVDGWLIGAREAVGRSWPVVAVFLVAVSAVTISLAPRLAAGPPPSRRYWLVAIGLVALGVAPILPTTYWLGRTAGTYGARILAAALPGAALLVLLLLARFVSQPRARAAVLSVVLTIAFAFHWNVGALAAENWAMQQHLGEALRATARSWPRGTFLVILDLPPNRLSYDTPWGVGRMIQETYGDPTLSGIGICIDRPPNGILKVQAVDLLVQDGFYARVPLEHVATLRFTGGALEPVPNGVLLERLAPGPE